MRYYDFAVGSHRILLPSTNEEAKLMRELEKTGRLNKDEMNIRDKELARKMVSKGLLIRKEDSEGLYFVKGAE